jgi:GTP-binding protein
MKINEAAYLLSGVKAEQYPHDGLPEIALVGRSNVGKSSLINALLNRRNLARTSTHPGKTRTANFYLVNRQFYLVDLPGYGYAKISQVERRQWQRMINDYLFARQELCLVVQIIDFRHPPTALDQEMYARLRSSSTRKLVVANKTDKVAKSQWTKHWQEILAHLPGLSPEQLVLFSAETKQGVDDVWRILSEAISRQID